MYSLIKHVIEFDGKFSLGMNSLYTSDIMLYNYIERYAF